MASRTLLFIPTFNERKNVEFIYERIRKTGLETDILFIDDSSPDGTGGLLDRLAQSDASLHVLHRSRKLGIGSAHAEGIRWAYDRGYQTLITMDCDFTHKPEDIASFIENSRDVDVVVGSRYLRRESLKEWNLFRKTLTRAGHFLTNRLLKLPHDTTGAFRLYRLDRIPRGVFEIAGSHGYSFFFESLYILDANGASIRDVPIDVPARAYGHSKMTLLDMMASLILMFQIYFFSIVDHGRYRLKSNK